MQGVATSDIFRFQENSTLYILDGAHDVPRAWRHEWGWTTVGSRGRGVSGQCHSVTRSLCLKLLCSKSRLRHWWRKCSLNESHQQAQDLLPSRAAFTSTARSIEGGAVLQCFSLHQELQQDPPTKKFNCDLRFLGCVPKAQRSQHVTR